MKKKVFKIVVIGEGLLVILQSARVGKTSIAVRYTENRFDAESASTVDACCLEKQHTLPDKSKITLSIWDTAGQEKYNALVPVYYRDAQAALIVYDITNQKSFDKVKKWVSELSKFAQPETLIMVVGNKTDLEFHRKISHQEVEEFSKIQNLSCFEVSAKTKDGIDELFENVAKLINQKNSKNKSSQIESGDQIQNSRWKKSKLVVEGQITKQQLEKKQKNNKKCCN